MNDVTDAVGALAMSYIDRTLRSGQPVTIPSLGIVIEGDNVSNKHDGEYTFDDPWITGLVRDLLAQQAAATKRAEDAEAVLAGIPMASLLRFVEAILMQGQPLQFDVDAVERWLKETQP